jgi:putative nucleotidyltransferase with HDIG domain
MAVQLTLIRSRVGRRVAVLLAVTGLAPLLALALVTGWMLSTSFEGEQVVRQRTFAKTSAMASLDRLLDVEERLRAVAGQPPDAPWPSSLRGVAALAQLDRQGHADPIFGAVAPLPLDAAARTRLAAGLSVLLVPKTADAVQMVVPAQSARVQDTLGLVAVLDGRALWTLDERVAEGRLNRELCAVAGDVVLSCTDPGLVTSLGLAPLAGAPSGRFEARIGPDDMTVTFWSAPIEAHFGLSRWTAVVLSRTADAAAPARALTRTVLLVAVATVCGALLIGLHQVRRLLDPIARLQAGTARLAHGEFATRVAVDTGDELQELGDAFNRMAGDLQRQFEQLHALSVGTLEALARAIDAKSPWTAGHSTRVAEVAVAVARALGFDAPALERVYRGGLLHDIGKIGIGAEILDKAGPLTEAEMAIVRQHPEVGARILEPLPHCGDILPMVRQHHERWDGGGYPEGLAQHDIALDARILAVADAYDALTSDRPYRRGMPGRDATVILADGASTQFDPAVIDAFLDAFRVGRIPHGQREAALDRPA